MSKLTKRELFQITKEHLTRYPLYKATLERKKEHLEEVKAKLDGLNATDYSRDRVSGTPTGDMLNTLVQEKIKLEEVIYRLETNIKNVDSAVNALPEVEQTIIRMYYIENNYRNKRTWIAIAYETNFCESQCRKLRSKAIDKISTVFEE